MSMLFTPPRLPLALPTHSSPQRFGEYLGVAQTRPAFLDPSGYAQDTFQTASTPQALNEHTQALLPASLRIPVNKLPEAPIHFLSKQTKLSSVSAMPNKELSDEDKQQLLSFLPPPTPIVKPFASSNAPTPSVSVSGTQALDITTHQVRQYGVQKALAIQPTFPPLTNGWHNQNRSMLQNGEAIIYALNIRTFGAKDKNADGKIDPTKGESGTFLSSIDRLPELKAMGVNTLHVLPINTVGKVRRLGEAGSLYATSDYTELNPQFIDPTSPLKPHEQARAFVNAAHQLGMHVMVDVPSCASYDLLKQHPELVAKDDKGKLLTPYNWIDIIMFQNGPKLLAYYDKFFKLMAQEVGVDGFRCDVARARPLWFWKALIDKYRSDKPQLGFLAESYIQEDQSPINNIPLDNPYGLLNVGFDTIYGQFHNFPAWNGDDYVKYLLEAKSRSLHQAGTGKT
ncbi:MAG: hypothetical protein ACKO37_10225, partial [Vampirovibrionales bacterium]